MNNFRDTFNRRLAVRYGVSTALLIEYLYHKNVSNEDIRIVDGKRYVMKGVNDIAHDITFITGACIGKCMKNLFDTGIVERRSFWISKYAKTYCYAFTQKGFEMLKKAYREEYTDREV